MPAVFGGWPADCARARFNETNEVRYWPQQFDCSPDQLRAAVSNCLMRCSGPELMAAGAAGEVVPPA